MNRLWFFRRAASLLSIFLVTSMAHASISVDNAIVSRYIWRGFDLTPNNNAATQPSVTFLDEGTGIFFNFWNSTGFDRDKTSGADEWDFSAGFSRSLSGLVSASLGYIYYSYPNIAGHNISHEFSAGLSFGTILSPSVTAYYDCNLGRGFYALASVKQGLGTLPITLGATAGYNSEMFIGDSGFTDFVLSASFSVPLPYENVRLSPGIFYALIPESMQGKGGISGENELWFSIAFGVTF